MDREEEGGEDSVTVRFVIPRGLNEFSVSEGMGAAFNLSVDSGFNAEWVHEDQVLQLSPTKTDVFVLESFEGETFKHLTKGDKMKCTVLGPKALAACLETNTPVPNLPYPMYTMAMQNLKITCSNIPKDEKLILQKLIQQMAGVYCPDFHDGITHVVTGSVVSDKYKVAVETETPVMTTQWIHQVWKASSRDLVSAVDPKFSKYKCPAFLGLSVSVSQLNREDKNILRKKIEEHGGVYQAELQMDVTNMLVCSSADGSKYYYAHKWRVPCVKPEWILDSVNKGYALPTDSYKVEKKNKASTPTKDTSSGAGLSDVSMCSTIMNPNESSMAMSRVDETVNCTALGTIAPEIQGKTTKDWLDELDLAKVKKAGTFLDGLRVYLSGFSESEQVQMTRVLKYAGATRLTQLVDSVTHIVHSVTINIDTDTARIIKDLDISPHSVSLEWIVESMKRGNKLREEDYIFPPPPTVDEDKIEKASRTIVEAGASEEHEAAEKTLVENNILSQYKQNNVTKPQDDTRVEKKERNTQSSLAVDASSQLDPFFNDIKFELNGFPEETEEELTEWITETGGEVMFSDFTGQVDYLITPLHGGSGKLKHKEHLTNLWIEECLDEVNFVEKQYYHYPVKQKIDSAPLEGIVTCVSGYTGKERVYINEVIALLGGNPQEMFAKKDNKGKEVKASTHLICNQPEGSKYNAALKWGIPTTDKNWIRSCLKEVKFVSEKPFLIGDSTAFTEGQPLPTCSLEDEETTLIDHEEIHDDAEDLKEEKEDEAILQDIDPNLSSSRQRKSARNSLEVSIKDKADKSTRSSRNFSPANISLKNDKESEDTPGTPATAVRNTLTAVKTPGLTPGALDNIRKPLNVYSPLPSQSWPDSQPVVTPNNGGVKRKRDGQLDDEMATPKTPYGDHLCDDPSPDTRKFFKRRKEGINKLGEMFRITADPITVAKQKQRQQEWLKYKPKETRLHCATDDVESEPSTSNNKESLDTKIKRLYQDMGKDWDEVGGKCADIHKNKMNHQQDLESKNEKCLEGVVVYIPRKIAQMNQDLEEIVIELGGCVSDELDHQTTHFIFQGKQPTKEFRQAKEMGKIIVATEWIYMCRSEQRKVDESAFPHTLNCSKISNQSQMSSKSASANKTRSRLSSKQKRPKPDFQEDEVMEEEGVETIEDVDDTNVDDVNNIDADDTEVIDTDLADKTEILASSTKKKDLSTYRNEEALKSLVDTLKNSPAVSICSSAKKEKQQVEKREESILERLTSNSTPVRKVEEKIESQVIWVDPEEEKKRQAIALKLSMETQDIGSINFTDTFETTDLQSRVFVVTGGVDEQMASEIIGSLGGELSTGNISPDNLPTHVVAAKVSRSEKMLQCIASGRWILHHSYLEDSRQANKWLQEEKYELGNPETEMIDLTNGSSESLMCIAARRRRLAANQGAAPIFSGMIVYLALPDHKQTSFLRLIETGGGTVLKEMKDDNIKTITHILSESKYYQLVKNREGQLVQFGIPVIRPIFLNDFLIKENRPCLDQYIVEDYKEAWQKKKKSRTLS